MHFGGTGSHGRFENVLLTLSGDLQTQAYDIPIRELVDNSERLSLYLTEAAICDPIAGNDIWLSWRRYLGFQSKSTSYAVL